MTMTGVAKPKLLDLFCGAGGCSVGYARAGFDVTGVDNEPQPRYPFRFYRADALEFVALYGHLFDAFGASPPCERDSVQTPAAYRNNHPDLIAPTSAILRQLGKPYIIENVSGARHKLINPIKLCGSMFGLKVFRHRYFEIYPEILLVPQCQHGFKPVYVTGSTGNSKSTFKRRDATIAEKREAMGIDWMVTKEMDKAILPAYTEWIGRQIIAACS